MNETRRHLDALCSTARAAQICYESSLASWLADIPSGSSLHINRHYDATPLRCQFGLLQDSLFEHARYLIPDGERPGKFKSVAWDEYHAIFPQDMPGKGILEIMGQTASAHTTNSEGHCESRIILIAPNVLLRANSGCIYASVDAAVRPLNMEAIRALACSLRIITLSEVPDNASANWRKRGYSAFWGVVHSRFLIFPLM